MVIINAKPPALSEEAKARIAAELRRPAYVLMVGALVRAILEGGVVVAPLVWRP